MIMKKIILSGVFLSLISLTVQGQTMRTAKSESGNHAVSHWSVVNASAYQFNDNSYLSNSKITAINSSENSNITNECDQGDITTNAFDDAYNITDNTPFRVAAGFTVAPATIFTIDTITVD